MQKKGRREDSIKGRTQKKKEKRNLEKKEKIEPLYLDITVMVCPIILHYL